MVNKILFCIFILLFFSCTDEHHAPIDCKEKSSCENYVFDRVADIKIKLCDNSWEFESVKNEDNSISSIYLDTVSLYELEKVRIINITTYEFIEKNSKLVIEKAIDEIKSDDKLELVDFGMQDWKGRYIDWILLKGDNQYQLYYYDFNNRFKTIGLSVTADDSWREKICELIECIDF